MKPKIVKKRNKKLWKYEIKNCENKNPKIVEIWNQILWWDGGKRVGKKLDNMSSCRYEKLRLAQRQRYWYKIKPISPPISVNCRQINFNPGIIFLMKSLEAQHRRGSECPREGIHNGNKVLKWAWAWYQNTHPPPLFLFGLLMKGTSITPYYIFLCLT